MHKTNEFNTFYDVNEYIHQEIEFFKNDKQEYLVSILMDEERDPSGVTEEEIINHFYYDQYLPQYHFEYFMMMLDYEFEKYVGKREVKVTGTNMGWRNRSGYKTFDLNDPKQIFTEIAPECDLTFYIKKISPEKYEIKLSHHDSPTGEFYNVELIKLPF
jgi:hypothetical protein